MRGNCYVTCEALYHLLGGKAEGWTPMHMRWENDTHWFLYNRDTDTFLDPTASQFKEPPTHIDRLVFGRGSGFLTKKPSKRARAMMQRMLWQ